MPSGISSYCSSFEESPWALLAWPERVMVPRLPFRKQFFSSSGPHWAEAGRADTARIAARAIGRQMFFMVMVVLLALPEEPVARRVDGPVDRGVAVHAALVEGVPRHRRVGRPGVARGLVALLAEKGLLHLEHLLVDR